MKKLLVFVLFTFFIFSPSLAHAESFDGTKWISENWDSLDRAQNGDLYFTGCQNKIIPVDGFSGRQILPNSDWSYKTIGYQNFKCADLSGINFTGTVFSNAIFNGSNLNNTIWGGSQYNGLSFVCVTAAGSNLTSTINWSNKLHGWISSTPIGLGKRLANVTKYGARDCSTPYVEPVTTTTTVAPTTTTTIAPTTTLAQVVVPITTVAPTTTVAITTTTVKATTTTTTVAPATTTAPTTTVAPATTTAPTTTVATVVSPAVTTSVTTAPVVTSPVVTTAPKISSSVATAVTTAPVLQQSTTATSVAVPQQQSVAVPQQQSVAVPQQQSVAVPQQQSVPVPQEQSVPVPQEQSIPDPQEQSIPVPLTQTMPNTTVPLIEKTKTNVQKVSDSVKPLTKVMVSTPSPADVVFTTLNIKNNSITQNKYLIVMINIIITLIAIKLIVSIIKKISFNKKNSLHYKLKRIANDITAARLEQIVKNSNSNLVKPNLFNYNQQLIDQQFETITKIEFDLEKQKDQDLPGLYKNL